MAMRLLVWLGRWIPGRRGQGERARAATRSALTTAMIERADRSADALEARQQRVHDALRRRVAAESAVVARRAH